MQRMNITVVFKHKITMPFSKFLSKGSKEVLIKLVAAALPTCDVKFPATKNHNHETNQCTSTILMELQWRAQRYALGCMEEIMS